MVERKWEGIPHLETDDVSRCQKMSGDVRKLLGVRGYIRKCQRKLQDMILVEVSGNVRHFCII